MQRLTADDRLDLVELIHRLCHALDYSRPDDFAAVFTPDGVYQAVSSVAAGEHPRFRHEGAAELLAFAEAAARKRQGLGRHWTGNVVLNATEAGASAVSYVAFLEIDPETNERRITISGTHRDSFVRSADGWRFTSRTVVADI
ncbi:nuclear transport factor 2 family protein [Actinoplanes sp. NPDC026619]|uniref:nuclear transport factor 2 family protein n=1 Tax=Actinoplanes sp. NPDC026619 TaxID=3155798 RepID=UPI0034053BB3